MRKSGRVMSSLSVFLWAHTCARRPEFCISSVATRLAALLSANVWAFENSGGGWCSGVPSSWCEAGAARRVNPSLWISFVCICLPVYFISSQPVGWCASLSVYSVFSWRRRRQRSSLPTHTRLCTQDGQKAARERLRRSAPPRLPSTLYTRTLWQTRKIYIPPRANRHNFPSRFCTREMARRKGLWCVMRSMKKLIVLFAVQ